MQNTLHLSQKEQELFNGLSEDFKEGWTIQPEALSYADTESKRAIRLSLLHLHTPGLLDLQESVRKSKNKEEFQKALEETDLSVITEGDLYELFFALGPEPMFPLVEYLFSKVETDEDMMVISAMTNLRHGLLESFQS